MALDLSAMVDLLHDPDFARPVTVMRNAVVADPATGRTTSTPTVTSTVAIVVPGSIKNLYRDPEATKGEDAVTMFSTFRLSPGDSGAEADLVLWDGRTWTVIVANDYSHFGTDIVIAECRMKEVR